MSPLDALRSQLVEFDDLLDVCLGQASLLLALLVDHWAREFDLIGVALDCGL